LTDKNQLKAKIIKTRIANIPRVTGPKVNIIKESDDMKEKMNAVNSLAHKGVIGFGPDQYQRVTDPNFKYREKRNKLGTGVTRVIPTERGYKGNRGAKRFTDRLMGEEIIQRIERIRELEKKSTKTTGDLRELADHKSQIDRYHSITGPQRPPKPTQKDRIKIISAKSRAEEIRQNHIDEYRAGLDDDGSEPYQFDYEAIKLRDKIMKRKQQMKESKIAKEHQHGIAIRYAKAEVHDIPAVKSGKYLKYFLLTAKNVNGNGWGVSPKTLEANIKKFRGKPFVVTAKSWIPDSDYDDYVHPHIPTNNLSAIYAHQEKYRVGSIVDVFKENDNWYAQVEIKPKFAHMETLPFCSPAIFQVNPHEPENAISQWEGLHLAGLDKDPAYGPMIAMLKGTCIGTPDECKLQFHGAKLIENIRYPDNRASFLTQDGKFISHHSYVRPDGFLFEHSDLADEIEGTIPVPGSFDKRFDRTREFMTKNNAIRIHDTGLETNVHVLSPINTTQLKRISNLIHKENDPDKSQFYDVNGDSTRDFKGFVSLLQKHKFHPTQQLRGKITLQIQRLAIQSPYKVGESPNVKINPQHGKIIADAYHSMKHEPDNPQVKASYHALISETGEQFKNLIKGGLKIDRIKGENPYPDSKSMHKDVEENNHLYYFPTEAGFGNESGVHKDHPMLQPTEFKHEGKPMLANDVFRIVHDINGHHVGGKSGFGPKGEHQAYLTHRKMYSPKAHGALATETMGQNNWVNFGPHGEKNRANPKNTIYAEQKAGLLPSHIVNGVFHNE